MSRRRVLGLLILSALGVWGYDLACTKLGVGGTRLEVEFVVTDAETGRPVEGAEIELRTESSLNHERPDERWTLVTDAAGSARRSVDTMCTGKTSGLRFTDTYSVRLPWWYYRVTAPGYELLDWTPLQPEGQRRRAERVGSHASRLVVPIVFVKRRSTR